MPDTIFKSAEQLAKRLGISRSALYTQAISEFVRKHKNDKVTAALNELYEKEDSSLEEFVLAMELASLENEEW